MKSGWTPSRLRALVHASGDNWPLCVPGLDHTPCCDAICQLIDEAEKRGTHMESSVGDKLDTLVAETLAAQVAIDEKTAALLDEKDVEIRRLKARLDEAERRGEQRAYKHAANIARYHGGHYYALRIEDAAKATVGPCVCGDRYIPNVVHRPDGPCYYLEQLSEDAARAAVPCTQDGRGDPCSHSVCVKLRGAETAKVRLAEHFECSDCGKHHVPSTEYGECGECGGEAIAATCDCSGSAGKINCNDCGTLYVPGERHGCAAKVRP